MKRVQPTRRQFITASAAAAAGLLVKSHAAWALSDGSVMMRLSHTASTRRTTPANWFTPSPAEEFRALAAIAMDAARQTGVSFADIRIGTQRQFHVQSDLPPSDLTVRIGFSVRACVDGVWAIRHGNILTPDAVARAARSVVATARAGVSINGALGARDNPGIADAPVVTGEWSVPIDVDPFAVPFDDSIRSLASWSAVATRLGNVGVGGALTWVRDLRVFASTTGSLVTQETTRSLSELTAGAWLPDGPSDAVSVPVAGFDPASVGYELVLAPGIPDRIIAAAEEAIRLRALPIRDFSEIGRYPMVFSGAAFATLVASALSPALDGDRAFGFEGDASGTTFLTPPGDFLSAATPTFSPLLNVSVHRALPSIAAVRWDDDGIVPEPYTVIDRGHVVDYHTTRETAPLMAPWYAQHGKPVRSHGGAVALTPTSAPSGTGGHVVVTPSATKTTMEDLMMQLNNGFVVRYVRSDPSPMLSLARLRSTSILEVKRGKAVGRISELSMNTNVKALFNRQLTALGDASTNAMSTAGVYKGMPWERFEQPATAPAALCTGIEVVRPYGVL